MNPLRHLDLFSGIGGFSLAARWTGGIETVAFCENHPYCQQILRKHWPHVYLHADIHTLTPEVLHNQGLSTIDLLTGGFPCQPFSCAGKRAGAADDRHLWPQMRRVIAEVRPRWIVAENVAHFVRMALDECLSDLEAQGYEAWPLVLPACAVNAPHRRERVFIVAYREEGAKETIRRKTSSPAAAPSMAHAVGFQSKQLYVRRNPARTSGDLARAGAISGAWSLARSDRLNQAEDVPFRRKTGDCNALPGDWSLEPGVGRMAHGIPHQLDRLRCLGNAVVPQLVYPLLKAITEWEMKEGIRASTQ